MLPVCNRLFISNSIMFVLHVCTVIASIIHPCTYPCSAELPRVDVGGRPSFSGGISVFSLAARLIPLVPLGTHWLHVSHDCVPCVGRVFREKLGNSKRYSWSLSRFVGRGTWLGPWGALPLESVYTRCSRKKTRKKGISKSGVHGRGKGVKNAKNGGKAYPIRYDLAMRSNVERVGNLRQHVH